MWAPVPGTGCEVGAWSGDHGTSPLPASSRRPQESSNKAGLGLGHQGLEPGLNPQPGAEVLGPHTEVQRPCWDTGVRQRDRELGVTGHSWL